MLDVYPNGPGSVGPLPAVRPHGSRIHHPGIGSGGVTPGPPPDRDGIDAGGKRPGLVTAVAGLLGDFLSAARDDQELVRAAVLVSGLVVVYVASRSAWVDRRLSRLITKVLHRYTDLDVRDYARLLHLSGEYSVREMAVCTGDWMAGHSLGELRLKDEGVLVLGVVHGDGAYVGAPGKDTVINAGDTVSSTAGTPSSSSSTLAAPAIRGGRWGQRSRPASRAARPPANRLTQDNQAVAGQRQGNAEERGGRRHDQEGECRQGDHQLVSVKTAMTRTAPMSSTIARARRKILRPCGTRRRSGDEGA